jgi:hypothetical protein
LTGVDLSGADLTGADLLGANLTGANLDTADLTGADLTNANLTNADVTNGVFTGATLTGVVSSGLVGIPAQLPSGWRVVNGAFVWVPTPAGGNAQTSKCATGTSLKSIPTRGNRKLLRPDCRTNAGQVIGVKVTARMRGDLTLYRLYCQVGSNRSKKPVKTKYGNAAQYCRRGALKIQTYGHKLQLRIVWTAPATDEFDEYQVTRKFRT